MGYIRTWTKIVIQEKWRLESSSVIRILFHGDGLVNHDDYVVVSTIFYVHPEPWGFMIQI